MVSNTSEHAAACVPPGKPAELRLRSPLFVQTGVALALMVLAGCGSPQKAELDREVDRLCAIDGGVHIYEVVRLPKEDFGPDGTVFPQYRHLPSNSGRFGSAYVDRVTSKVLVAGDPSLVRLNISITRRADEKLLGEVVIYGRRGGDGPGLSEPSSYLCPKGPAFDLEQQVFRSQEK
jgi:hypothetical protein